MKIPEPRIGFAGSRQHLAQARHACLARLGRGEQCVPFAQPVRATVAVMQPARTILACHREQFGMRGQFGRKQLVQAGQAGIHSNFTSADMPARSLSASFFSRTLMPKTCLTRSSTVWTLRGVN